MICNETISEEFPLLLKSPCERGLQWSVMGGLLRNLPPTKNIPRPNKTVVQEWAVMGFNWLQGKDF